MALNFPASPTPGQTYTDQGRTFVWNGSTWMLQAIPFSFATLAELQAGTITNKVVSPAVMKQALDALPETYAVPLQGSPTVVTGSRTGNVNYQNPFAWSMLVVVAMQGGGSPRLLVGAANPANIITADNGVELTTERSVTQVLVPPGWWYRLQPPGGTIEVWTEWR